MRRMRCEYDGYILLEVLVTIVILVFGLLGLVLLFLGYKIFDWLTPHLHIEKELAEKNLAVAIVVAAILIALGIIVARTVGA